MRRIVEDNHGIEWVIEWKDRVLVRYGQPGAGGATMEFSGLVLSSELGALVIPRDAEVDLRSTSFRDLAALIEERWYRGDGGGTGD